MSPSGEVSSVLHFTGQKPFRPHTPGVDRGEAGAHEGWGGLSGSPSLSVCHLLASCRVRVPAGLLCVLKSGSGRSSLGERAIQSGDALMCFVILCAPKSNGALYSRA